MIINSISLNNIQNANNILFQKRNKNRTKGHIATQKPDIFVKRNNEKVQEFGLDCSCKNKKNCVNCQRHLAEFRHQKGVDVLSAEDFEFIEENPDIASLANFDYCFITNELIKNGSVSTGSHFIRYIHDENDGLRIFVSAIDNEGVYLSKTISKFEFLNLMNRIKSIATQLESADKDKMDKSFELLKKDLDKIS